MKKTRLLSILLSVVLVLGCVPMMAVSADELTDVDVSTVLSVDSSYTGTIDETDPYISTDYWNGYAKGFTVELEPDVIYTINVYAECGDADYMDRAIAVIPDGATDVSGNDIAYAENSGAAFVTTTLKCGVTEAGKYNVIVWGYCDDVDGNPIVGESTSIEVELSESPAMAFDKKLTVGKAYTGTVNETDPYIETNAWAGYVQGFYADLKAGEYKITATVSGEGAVYADRAIAVHPDGVVADAYEGSIAYNSMWADADTVTVSVIFVVEKAGIYKIPVWGYLDDENNNGIFGEGTSLTVLIDDDLTQEDYLGMPITATLTVGTAYKGTLGETDPYISTYGWNGYAKAFAVELEAGKMYSAYAYAECEGAYIDRAIAIVPEKFMGDYSEDCIAYAWDDVEDGKAVIDFFTVEEDGTYYVIEWGYCEDADENNLTGDSTYLEVCVDYVETSVIDIYTSDDLVQFNADMHDGKYNGVLEIVFHDDIDMTDIAWDSTFDTGNVYFNINGNGYTITNLCAPLLDIAYDAYIYDLDMNVDLEFVTDPELGEEVYNFGLYAGYVENSIVMSNCHVTGDIVFDGYVNRALGALVGEMYGEGYNSKFVNCSFEGSITTSGGRYIGGLVGDVEYDTTFENCYANVTIDAPDSYDIGGLVGYVEDYNSFDRCYAIVDINGGEYGYEIGGLAGIIDEDNLFIDCYAEGTVQGRDNIGGLVGDSSCCGYNNFINCYTTVDVTGVYHVGGFIGEAYDSDNFENCYAAGSVTCTDDYYIDYVGMFLGYSYYDSMTFTNCFAAYSEDYGAYGDADGFEINGIIYSVNFEDEDHVANMEDTLNEYVEEKSGLYYWAGRNDANGPEFSETPPFIKGDVNGDDKVNMFDYVALKSHVLGKSLLSDDKLVRADVNGDGKINMFDYVALKAQVIKG